MDDSINRIVDPLRQSFTGNACDAGVALPLALRSRVTPRVPKVLGDTLDLRQSHPFGRFGGCYISGKVRYGSTAI
ncbi:hypothetical protein [Chamaesiphon sp.]|uniref:hypothetical protein n=1 Tax=Chamaesiphon sp. TaxID=2814140 RepID=UPI00359384BC